MSRSSSGPGSCRSVRGFPADPAVWIHGRPDVPAALVEASERGFALDLDDTTFFLGVETLLATRRPGMPLWRERLFVWIARNAVRANTFFKIPPERVVELGMQVEL
jgi:KUP system potassium uptake protein